MGFKKYVMTQRTYFSQSNNPYLIDLNMDALTRKKIRMAIRRRAEKMVTLDEERDNA